MIFKKGRGAIMILKKSCPQCGGTGIYISETDSRYGGPGNTCDRCDGTGRVKRFGEFKNEKPKI